MVVILCNIRLARKDSNLISGTDVMSIADDGIHTVAKVDGGKKAQCVFWRDLPVGFCADVEKSDAV